MMSTEKSSEYGVGKEFIIDSDRIDVVISYHLFSNVFITNFESQFGNYKIHGSNNGRDFVVEYERPISKKLFYDLKENQIDMQFVYGYFSRILPIINTEINKQKYLNGQILNRPITCFDINKITLLYKETGECYSIFGQFIFDNRLKSFDHSVNNDPIFIREYIDAITSYLLNNYDDSIRKLITSIENFFIFRNMRGTFNEKLISITSGKYHLAQWKQYMNVLQSNTKFIYTVRNKIVHDELRVRFNVYWSGICKQGIGTINYIYQNNLIEQDVKKYMRSIIQQFLLITTHTSGLDLDDLENFYNSDPPSEKNIIKAPADLDKHVFNQLRIPEEIKRIILNG